jgi:Carboxypeptidase regulatory-like domain
MTPTRFRCSPYAPLLAALALATSAAGAGAQGLAGTVRDSASRISISGAVLTVVDSSGTALARQLTDERGEYRIPLGSAARTLRVVRIGFEPRDLAIPSRRSGDTRLDISLLALSTMMRPVRIVANSHCPVRKDGAAARGLWEQARAGLLATVVAREENPASVYRLLYERVMDGNSDRIETMRVRADSAVDTISFAAARSARDFVRFGFRHDTAGRRSYFGPDAVVLLSEDFADAYCFQIAAANSARPHQAGIRFLPAVRERERTDVDGTLWIDTVARELREVEFRYLGVPASAEPFHPGGQVSFRTMPNGVVLVDRWSIRSVNASIDTVVTAARSGGGDGRPGRRGAGRAADYGGAYSPLSLGEWLFADVIGGELARATWHDGLVWHAPLGTLRVRAVTADGKPAPGTLVALVGTPYFGNADSAGNAELKDLVPGPYAVRVVVDPRLAELGVGFRTPLKFTATRDSTTTATLTVPTAEAYMADACATSREQKASDSVFVMGRVVTPDGRPVAEARVAFASPNPGAPAWRTESRVTGPDGLFMSCHNWNIGDEILIRVKRDGAQNLDVTRRFDSKLLIVSITVPPSP